LQWNKPPGDIVEPIAVRTGCKTIRQGSRRGSAALAGAATGLRSTVGLAALIDAGAAGLPALLTGPRARAVARLAVASELVLDKLPSTPSRLEPAGLAGRIVFAAVAGAVLARGADQPVLEAVVIASAAAIAGAKLGHDARVAAAELFPPFAVAVAEDGLALGLAAVSSRRRR
jgi:uncharacterized membrane protein